MQSSKRPFLAFSSGRPTLGCDTPKSSCTAAGNPNPTFYRSGQSRTLGQAPIRSYRYPLKPGNAGVQQAIVLMTGAVIGNEGASHPVIRKLAVDIVRQVPNRDSAGELAAVLNWVKQNISFRGENGETIQTPIVTLHMRAGDCDDHSTLIASLLKALGYKARFRTVAADSSAPDQYSHVYVEALNRNTGQWMPLDSTVAESYPGWAPKQGVTRSRSWKGLGDAVTEVQGNLTPGMQLTYDVANLAEQAYVANATGSNPSYASSPAMGAISAPELLLFGGGALVLLLLLMKGKS